MANNNFNFLTVVVVSLVVAVIASLITASITGNVIKVQEKRKGTEVYTKEEIDKLLANINAVSCDEDDQCETKSLIADSPSRIGTVVIDGKTISTKKGSTSALVLTSDVKYVVVDGSLNVLDLSGHGNVSSSNAYVCTNINGSLYRSSKPCV